MIAGFSIDTSRIADASNNFTFSYFLSGRNIQLGSMGVARLKAVAVVYNYGIAPSAGAPSRKFHETVI